MDIYELSDKSGVSVRTIRKIEKFGVLNLKSAANPLVERMKKNMKHGNRLTAEQQLHLFKNPQDHKLLSTWSDKIQDCLNELGDVTHEKMPWEISSNIALAAVRDMEATNCLAEWICKFIDQNPAFANGASCDHAYLAVRMLADIPERFLCLNAPVIAKAMWNCRRTRKMAGYWNIDLQTGRTRYHRPVRAFNL